MNISREVEVASAADSILEEVVLAEDALAEHVAYLKASREDTWYVAAARRHLEMAFTQLLVVAEALHLHLLRAEIAQLFEKARSEDIALFEVDEDGYEYLKWASPLRRHAKSLRRTFSVDPERAVTRHLESILRATIYSITDARVFSSPPQEESEVHHRIEAVLKCIFPVVKHKPVLTKPIKNFEPDTGIPSLETLIEYKFLKASASVPRVADEILADTRAYNSPGWSSFVFVIYETRRFRSELEWRQLLRESGVGANTSVIVLSGEPVPAGEEPVEKKRYRGMQL
ncbi:MAG: hypothetical protein GY722_28755 [bacterium]|nr:hypothetical protein [bacterium]